MPRPPDLAQLLAWLAPRGALPGPLRRGARTVGLAQVLTTRVAATELLEDPEVLVPYQEHSEPLGLAEFPLALDGPAHQAARTLVAAALAASQVRHEEGVRLAAGVAADALAGARRSVDVVAEVLDPALAAWIEHWFGLPEAGPDLLLVGRLVTHATFLNPPLPGKAPDVRGLVVAVDEVEHHRRQWQHDLAGAASGTLASTLLDGARHVVGEADGAPTGEAREEAAADLAARHLVGLTVGPLALVHQTVARAIDHLLDDPWRQDVAVRPAAAAQALRRGIRAAPPLPGVLRQVPTERDVWTGRSHVTVPPGLVLVATASAARLGDHDEPDLAFGHGGHRCLGEDHTVAFGAAVLESLAARRPRRRAGRAGRVRPGTPPSGLVDWSFPGHLEVDLRA